jgi:hypothetical protein
MNYNHMYISDYAFAAVHSPQMVAMRKRMQSATSSSMPVHESSRPSNSATVGTNEYYELSNTTTMGLYGSESKAKFPWDLRISTIVEEDGETMEESPEPQQRKALVRDSSFSTKTARNFSSSFSNMDDSSNEALLPGPPPPGKRRSRHRRSNNMDFTEVLPHVETELQHPLKR